jgi:hypothetical protein
MTAGFAAIFNQVSAALGPFAVVGDPPVGLVGVPYSYTFGYVNGAPPVEFGAIGSLPPGLTLDPDTGEVYGAPAGVNVTITGLTEVYLLVGVDFEAAYTASGGDPMSTVFSEAGALPPGVSGATTTSPSSAIRTYSGATSAGLDPSIIGPAVVYVLKGVSREWARYAAVDGVSGFTLDDPIAGLPPGLTASITEISGVDYIIVEGEHL